MRRGDRQVDDHIKFAVLEQRIGCLGDHAKFLGPLLRGCGNDVGYGTHLEPLEQRRQAQIRSGDVAGTHDADAISLGHAYFHFLAAAIERVAKRTASEGLSCSATKYCALVLLVTLVISSSQFRTPCPTSAQPSSSR